jgi:hypothetical protein
MTINQSHTDDDGHLFNTVSTHRTSEGLIVYRHCACSLWRIERYPTVGRRLLEAVVDRSSGALPRSHRTGAEECGRSPALATGRKA